MNQAFVTRAPGKLFLLGEYAVLDGAPAVVVAVDQYVEVRLEARRSRATVHLAAPGHCQPFEIEGKDRDEGREELRFATATLELARNLLPEIAGVGFDIEIRSGLDRAASTAGARKLGLGGSAAVTAALTAALYAASGRRPETAREQIFACAFAAHRSAQGGVGSGADVAAAVYGGAILFEARGESLPRVTRLEWPASAELLVGWSGESASTSALVRRYLALESAAGRRHFVEASRTAVTDFLDGLCGGRLRSEAIRDAALALDRLARHGALPLYTPSLDRLIALARDAGAPAKLSGAGGGDCAIALAEDSDTAGRVRAAWTSAGFTVLDLRLDQQGVTVAEA